MTDPPARSDPVELEPDYRQILAAYGGIFVAGSLAWGMIIDGFRPDRYDIIGAGICLIGIAVIMQRAPLVKIHGAATQI